MNAWLYQVDIHTRRFIPKNTEFFLRESAKIVFTSILLRRNKAKWLYMLVMISLKFLKSVLLSLVQAVETAVNLDRALLGAGIF